MRNLDTIYSSCMHAQVSLVMTADKLCKKRNLPPLDITSGLSWVDVEESVLKTCNHLEKLAEQDKDIPKGFSGKIKKGFRNLCHHAGVGTTLSKMAPSDSYCAALCGGFKIVFMALEHTGRYREEIYKAIDEIPTVLNDHKSLLELCEQDAETHTLAAGLFASLFGLLEEILKWFLKPPVSM